MNNSYLTPVDVEMSFSTPFRNAFGDQLNGNGDDSRDYGGGGNETFDLLQNGLERLGLSDTRTSFVESPPKTLFNSSVSPNQPTMGVAESKENVIDDIPPYANRIAQDQLIEKPESPKFQPRLDVQPHSIFSPLPTEPTKGDQQFVSSQISYAPTSPNSFFQQKEAEAKAQQLAIEKMEEELAKQEAEFAEQLAEADKTLSKRQEELRALNAKVEAVKAENEANSKEKKAEKYEARISGLKSDLDSLKFELTHVQTQNKLMIEEREQVIGDLLGVENAYADLMRKYLRAKESITSYHETQQGLKARDLEMQEKIKMKDMKFNVMQNEVQDGLEQVYQEFEVSLMEKKNEHENLRVRLMRMEMRASTLEKDLEQKSRENAQLHALCDDIINGRVSQ